MNIKNLVLFSMFILVGCNSSQNHNISNMSLHSNNSILSTENSKQSIEYSNLLESTKISSSNSFIPITNKVLKYSYHPMSEPSINKQLITFNPMGELNEVWKHYRGDNVLVAVIDSGFDYTHP